MNIGIVTTWFERGAAYVSKAFADVLGKKHNVFIYARGGEKFAIGDEKWDAGNVTWGRRYSDISPRINWTDFKKWLAKYKINSLLFNEQNDWEVVINCRKLNITLLAYVDYYKQNTVELYNLYDAVICNTRRHYEIFKNHNNCIYIPWGTDVNLFKPLNVPTDKLTFFHSAGMGGVNLRKGTEVSVRCFNKLKGDIKFIIHSQVSVDKLGDLASLIKNDSRIEFIHRDVTAPGLYHMGDVYIYPSKLEGIGLTIAEALSCGLPVITTNNAPMNEFVVHNKNGKLVKVNRYVSRPDGYFWPESEVCEDSLYTAMSEIYDEFKINKLINMKYNARKFAQTNLNWEKNSRGLCDLIDNVEFDHNKIDNLNRYRSKALGISYVERKCWLNKLSYYFYRAAGIMGL